MHRSIPVLITAAMSAVPIGSTFLDATPLTTLTGPIPAYAAARIGAPVHVVIGPSTNMRWGPVRVTIIVRGRRITDIKVTAPIERARSAIINNRAVPMLRGEALRAQTANVQFISGATMTSKAFVTSLQAAMKQAHL